jgi:hypothetical protein
MMRPVYLVLLSVMFGCVDLSTICPYHEITQGVFGEVVDSTGTLEQNVEVEAFGIENGSQGSLIGSAATTRGGYQFKLNPSMYMICAEGTCTTVTVPTGLVELSGTDTGAAVTWESPAAVPPDQSVGPCKYGD